MKMDGWMELKRKGGIIVVEHERKSAEWNEMRRERNETDGW